MKNKYIHFIRNKNTAFGDDLFIEGQEDEFGFIGTAIELLNPFTAAKSYYKKGVSGVIAEARTELADKDAPKDSLAAKIQRAAPTVVETVGLTEQTATYLRALDRGWKGPYNPNGTMYYWDKKKNVIKYHNPDTGKYVKLKKGNKSYNALSNSMKLSWSPTSKSYFPYKDKKPIEGAPQVSSKKKKKSKSTAVTSYDASADMALDGLDQGGFFEKAKQHVTDNWIAYTAGGVALVGLPLLFMTLGSMNKDWMVIMNGEPVGSISEFYDVNRVGNQHNVDPISDIDMTMILALQPGEKHVINLGAGGMTVIERAV